MRPQSDSSNTFNRRIVFTIISSCACIAGGCGGVGCEERNDRKSDTRCSIAYSYTDSKRDGYSYCYSKCSGFATAFWHQSGTVYR